MLPPRQLLSKLLIACTAVFLTVTPAALAAEEPDRPTAGDLRAITLYLENDSEFTKPNNDTDEHYTNGGAFTFAHQPAWAWDIADWMPGHEGFGKPDDVAVGYMFGQLMFTSRNLRLETPPDDEHPYSGYLFGGAYFQRAKYVSDRVATLDHFQLDLGVIGPSSLAADVQKSVHETFDAVGPGGWDTQMPDEFAIQAYVRKKWRFDLNQPGGWDVQVIPQVGAALGLVYRHLEAGATLRAGWNLPNDFGPGRIADVAAATGGPNTGWGVYGFARAGGRIVEHNVFLEGSNYHDYQGVDEERLVGELEAGLRLGYRGDRWAIELGYSQTFLTPQFETERGSDSFGAYTLTAFCFF